MLGGFFLALVAAGCGGGSSAGPSITIGAARIYHLGGFRPVGPVKPGVPATVAFTVIQPDGSPLTKYKHGAGPHNGVHLIIVRRDLGVIIHHHPPVGPNGRIVDRVTFPSPGPYRVVIDVYPQPTGPASQTNFQLFVDADRRGHVQAAAAAAVQRERRPSTGYRFVAARRARI